MHFLRAHIASIIILASWCIHPHVAPSLQSYITTVHHVYGYIPSIALGVGAFYHYPLIASVQICMFCNQHHPNHSNNKLWARMFQTSLINLSYYPHLLSISFVMNVTDIYHSYVVILALRELDHLSFLFLSNSSMYNLSMLSLYSSCHTPTAFTININLLWCDCFLPLLMGDLLLFH
jgi:hypothetical protein